MISQLFEYINMQPLRIRRLTSVVVIALLILFVYLLWGQRLYLSCASSSSNAPDLHGIWYHCNSLEVDGGSSAEGSVSLENYKLELVAAVIRHGDREVLHSIPNHKKVPLSCNMKSFPYLQRYVPNLQHYTDTLDANKNYVDAMFLPYGMYPQEEMCRDGFLTPIGAAQHVKNGVTMNNAYMERWKLLKKDVKNQVTMVTTLRQRTFQSGMALLYGFLPTFDLSNVQVIPSQTNNFCDNNHAGFSCFCPAATMFSDVHSQTYGQNLFKFKSIPEMKVAYAEISEIFDTKFQDLPPASHIMDVSMASMCHNMALPGHQNKCISHKALRTIVETLNINGRKNNADKTYHRICLLKMLPFLSQLLKTATSVISGEDSRRFLLFSGHDSTVDPLSTALGIGDGSWPKYASRVVFEFYTSINPQQGAVDAYVRILLNGNDVTDKVVFCKNSSTLTSSPPFLCPLALFKEFIDKQGFISEFGFKTYSEACNSETII